MIKSNNKENEHEEEKKLKYWNLFIHLRYIFIIALFIKIIILYFLILLIYFIDIMKMMFQIKIFFE